MAGSTALAPDEAYYWVWSRALAPGYLDHPPMVALWIWLGTAIAGPGALGVRLLAPLAAALGSVLLVQAAEDLLPGRRAGLIAAYLLNATLLFGVGAVTMTPDTPLLLFWTATLWALARLHATGRPAWWLAAGVAGGLALDSKYTAALLAPAVLVWLLAVPVNRQWLRRPWPWLGLAAALLLFAPVLGWNAAHDWISFAKQGGRTGDWDMSRALQFIGELFGAQLLLATPLLAVLFGGGIALAAQRGWRRDPVWVLLAGLTALPALVFLQHALGDRVQANWPAVIYPGAAIAAAGLAPRWSRLHRPAAALGLVLTGLVYAQSIWFLLPLPAGLDPAQARLAGWETFAAATATAARGVQADYVVAENYGDAAELALLLPPGLRALGHDTRWRFFRLRNASPATGGPATGSQIGLLVQPARYGSPLEHGRWASAVKLADLSRLAGGVAVAQYGLYRVSGPAGQIPLTELPRP